MADIKVKLPDGSVNAYPAGSTPLDIAKAISEGLAREAVVASVDGELKDMTTTLTTDVSLEIIKFDDPRGKEVFWHSSAHILAQAVLRLFPNAKPTIGPPLKEGGFYYDFADLTLKEEDLSKIEEEMKKIAKENHESTRIELSSKEEAKNLFKSKYKQEIINESEEKLSAYEQGEFVDLCRGPHIPRTGMVKAVWVYQIASAYWKGDAKNEQLTRLYGITFPDKKLMKQHKTFMEEAKKRDHRKLGKELNLFTISEQVGAGLILWSPKGSIIRKELQDFISEHLDRQGYSQVFTPHIGRLELFKTSGHFPYYQDSQFPPMVDRDQLKQFATQEKSCAELANFLKDGAIEGHMLKPMNCPFHINIYSSQMRSYKELPLRLAEFGTVYRWEQSGEIGGMTRVRGFTQDDAHIFCTEEQVAQELMGCIELVKIIFSTLGMEDYRVRVGLRNPDSDKYTGTNEQWDQAEADCIAAAKALGASFSEEPGEAAFYGPKIDFVVRDVLNREWQLGTVQVDYQLPERFDLSYIDSDGKKKRPVMIHRAPFGSMERFVGVLIEHFAGRFPMWLAPEQVAIVPISEEQTENAMKFYDELKKEGVRVTFEEGDTLNKRIRDCQLRRIPAICVIGDKEVQAGTIALRNLEGNTDYGVSREDFKKRVLKAINERTLKY